MLEEALQTKTPKYSQGIAHSVYLPFYLYKSTQTSKGKAYTAQSMERGRCL